MKKLLLALALLAFVPGTAYAGNDAGAFIGGLIGGIIIGDAINNHKHHRPRPRVQYYEDYNYYSNCWTEKRKEWDPYRRVWYTRYVRYCD